MAGPKVSILIPVYNRELFIADCIRSVLRQTMTDLEVVVVDNASTDRTYEICRRFEAEDARVRVFRNQDNIGPVRNIARCMEKATGTYGKILFSDDEMEPDFLEKTLPLLEDKEVGFVFTSVWMGPSSEEGEIFYRYAPRTGAYTSQAYLKKALLGENVPLSPGCAIFRLKDMRANYQSSIPSPSITDFDSHGAGPDFLLYLLTAAQYNKVAYVDDPLCFFRMHDGSITISDKARYLDTCYRQTRIWFACEYMDRKMFKKTVAYLWLQESRAGGKRLPPNDFMAAYLQTPYTLTLKDVLMAWTVAAQRKLNRVFKNRTLTASK